MKHRGPASSLHPAREAARAQERATSSSSLPSTGVRGAAVFGDWTVTTDEHGRLVGDHTDGTRHVLATPSEEN